MRFALIAVLAGCYNPTIAPGAPCNTSDQCPAGQQCVGGVCGGTEQPSDAPPVTPDGGVDAPPDSGADAPTITSIVIGEDADEIRDSYLTGGDPAGNYADLDHCAIDDAEICIIWFDLSAIEPGRTIVSASLTVTTYDEADESGGTATVHRVRERWVETQVTFIARTSFASWSSAGVEPPASDATPVATFSPAAVETPYTMALPVSMVQDWVDNPSLNCGLVFFRKTTTQHVHLHTRESGASWARLAIDYY